MAVNLVHRKVCVVVGDFPGKSDSDSRTSGHRNRYFPNETVVSRDQLSFGFRNARRVGRHGEVELALA